MAIAKKTEILSGVTLPSAYMRISSYSCENIDGNNSLYKVVIDVYANKEQRDIERQSKSAFIMAQKQLENIRKQYSGESPNTKKEVFEKIAKLSSVKIEEKKAVSFEVQLLCCEDATREDLYKSLSAADGWEGSLSA